MQCRGIKQGSVRSRQPPRVEFGRSCSHPECQVHYLASALSASSPPHCWHSSFVPLIISPNLFYILITHQPPPPLVLTNSLTFSDQALPPYAVKKYFFQELQEHMIFPQADFFSCSVKACEMRWWQSPVFLLRSSAWENSPPPGGSGGTQAGIRWKGSDKLRLLSRDSAGHARRLPGV